MAAIVLGLAPTVAAQETILDLDEIVRSLPTPTLADVQRLSVLAQPPAVPPAQGNPFGLGWGGGFAFSSNLVGVPLVDEGGAFIDVNDIIRITHPRNVKSRILLESHYTFKISGPLAVGPVIFVQPSGESMFDAAGGGLLIELGEGSTSFNFLVGLLVDFEVSRLHRDYIDGFRSPTAELVFVHREEVQLVVGFTVGRDFW